MQLTKNFSYEELIASPTAKRLGIDNSPSKAVRENLEMLAKTILQPIRNAFKHPIVVTSGYRCPSLNSAVGGAFMSDHKYGNAADIRTQSDLPSDNKKLWQCVVKMWKAGQLPMLKQCINEFNYDWVHVSFQDGRSTKVGQFLDAKKVNGKTTYVNSKI